MPTGFGFEPCSPRYGPFLVFGLFDTTAHIRPFLAIFGPFLGHIVDLEGKNELFVMGQLRRTWSVATVSLRLAILIRFWGRLGPKEAILGSFHAKRGCFGAQNAQLWEGTSRLGAPAPGRHQ